MERKKMNWLLSHEEIESELIQIEQSFLNTIVAYNNAISYCQRILEQYRSKVVSNGFPDEASEIQFFKIEKPFLFGQLLRYIHQLNFELEYAKIAYDANERIIPQKILEVNTYLFNHRNIVLYVELGNDSLDQQYFLRKNKEFNSCSSANGISFDPDFSSSHDVLLANIFGYQGFLQFLQQKLRTVSLNPDTTIPQIPWTESKVALTELAFALFYSGSIDKGNASLKSIIRFLEQVTGTDLGDYHHTSVRFRNRSQPTKFMNKLTRSLENWMSDVDD
ncbi:MAG: RteC domain-containing protein [Arenibacter latericius]|nr:RteC domain-containing protein [Arenibacter latericius]